MSCPPGPWGPLAVLWPVRRRCAFSIASSGGEWNCTRSGSRLRSKSARNYSPRTTIGDAVFTQVQEVESIAPSPLSVPRYVSRSRNRLVFMESYYREGIKPVSREWLERRLHRWLKTWLWHERIEWERRNRSARRVDLGFALHQRQQMTPRAFPVEKEKWNAFLRELKQQVKHDISLAGT